MKLRHEHPWNLSPQEARRLQKQLRAYITIEALKEESIQSVGGVDASFSEKRIYAAAVVLDYATLEPIDQASTSEPLTFPYIPGLLSFREAPAILSVLARLKHLPDVLIVNGHGYAHPRRFGIACHLGVLLDLPTIGLAKSILVGYISSLSESKGSCAELLEDDQLLGLALRTRTNIKPVYLSIGHRVDLSSAVRIVLHCSRGYRLPQPARLAHQLASKHKELMEEQIRNPSIENLEKGILS